ncbi:hypothetical protein [Polaromonas sp. CG9_12]|nr:hypothetical protein [Polaromonas sp. CG9_12]
MASKVAQASPTPWRMGQKGAKARDGMNGRAGQELIMCAVAECCVADEGMN